VTRLRIAEDLTLPIETVTQAIAILAKRRVGKSYTARRFAEQLFKANQQIVIVDPKGDHWGIRSAADGKSPGLPVVILGGEHGDVPLEVSSGEVIAKLAAEERVSMLLDLSLFRKHEIPTFMTPFLEGLYRIKAREAFRTPLMLEVDEADAIAPQKPQPNEARMLGAIEDIVRRGGQRGLGCILITQRSAVLNKNVLTQAEMIVALRTIAPQDLEALDAWVEVHGTKEQRTTLMASLPSLPVGDAWFWSPGWPTENGIFKRVHVLPIETFDSGASPKAGEKRVEPKNLADIDLGALQKSMAATIEKAKENDPKLLKSEIARLKGELAKKSNGNGHAVREKLVVDTTAIDRAVKRAIASEREGFRVLGRNLGRVATNLRKAAQAVDASASDLSEFVTEFGHQLQTENAIPSVASVAARPQTAVERSTPGIASTGVEIARRATPERRQSPIEVGDVVLSGTERRMLNAIAQFHALGLEAPSRAAVAGYVGVSHTTGTFSNNLSDLRKAGVMEDAPNGGLRLTPAGRRVAQVPDSPPSLGELHATWYQKLSGTQSRMLQQIVAAYPDPVSRSAIAEALGVQSDTGTFSNNLSKLRTLGLISDYSKSEVIGTELLFPEGLS
jgi:hypothetical protein